MLNISDTILDSHKEDYTGQLIILNEERLKVEYKTPINQIWTASHGPGCKVGSFSDTVHLRHPIDHDYMIVSRSDILGVAKPEVLEKLMQENNNIPNEENDEEFDR